MVDAVVTDDKRVSVDYHATLTVSATNYTSGRCEVAVADNDVPRFELVLSPSTVSEGDGPQCVVATLRRTDNIDKAVNVRVKASDAAGVLCSVSQVGFAAGVREQSFFIGVVDNAVVDGEREYQISAGVHFPDYGLTAGEGEQGFACALLKVDVDFYVEMPNKMGVYYLYAQVDAPSNAQEINEHNNVSTACKVTLTAPFTVRTSVDKDEVKVGETVTINGKATGSNVVNAAVNIIYEWNGKVYKVASVTTDSKGEFAVQYVIPKTQPGSYRFGACYGKDAKAADEDMCSLCAYGWKVDNKMFVSKSIEVGQKYTGSVTITNNCPKPLTGVRVDCGELPEGVTLTWDVPSRIEGNESVKASFALTPKVQASEAVNLAVMLKSDQCNDMELSGRYAAYNPYPNLESEVSHISTSATKGRQKIYKLSIGNSGNGPTGAITLALPDFIKSLSGTTIKSLAYGETTTITLGITPADDAAVNVSVSGRIGINCAKGNGIAIPYDINIVSEETGTLHVDVCDEFTYYTDGAPQVQGAEVEVRNYNTNEVAYSGTTNEKGYVEPILTEGYYRLKVSASGHETFSGMVCVDPGKTTFKTVNLAIVDDIKVKYEVVETEVEDVYEIVTTTTFETAVPKPQLRLATSGNIAPKSQSYAQWFMTSTLMGHFTDYNVEATHVTSYDNPDLSLLNEVTIHELIRSVDVPGKDGMKGFICNDEKDDNNLPDIIYLTDGTKEPVGLCDKVSMEQIDDTNYRLTIVPSALGLYGWNYGNIRDPKNGKARIIKVVRESDGIELSLRNVWITHATMRDDKKPLYENLVHIADAVQAETTSYVVTYEDRSDTELRVKRFRAL